MPVKTILHTTTGLHQGGAETMLAKLIESQRDPRLRPVVLSLLPPGVIAERIRARSVRVHSLAMAEGRPSTRAALELVLQGRRIRPDLIQGWMHHGNVAATVTAWAVPGRVPVVWNVRHSLVTMEHEKPLTRLVLRLGARLSRTTAAIVYNARVSAKQYERFGFDPSRVVVIPNGFDCAQFRPRPEARAVLSRTFGIEARVPLVAMVARHHPMKDPENLIEAAGLVRAAGIDFHLLLVGRGFEQPPRALEAAARTALPNDRLTLSGERQDVAAWLGGLDLLVLPSAWGEGFPNILGEAMACGVPCAATDVGDSAWILGPHGAVVPPRDPGALAGVMIELLELPQEARSRLKEAARARVVEHFSLDRVTGQYEALYRQLLGG